MLRTALIVAGGSGSRMRASIPKQFLPLIDKPVLMWTVELFLSLEVNPIVLALPEAHIQIWQEHAQQFLEVDVRERVHPCIGGKTRTDSVYNGLKKLNDLTREPALVAIHDGVRPLVPAQIIEDSYEQALTHGASVVCVPVKASLRETDGDESRPVDRSRFWEVQTPQTFSLDKILDCYDRRPEGSFTDDASVYESSGAKVYICQGSYENLKLTTPEDMIIAERIIERRRMS